MNLNLDFTSLRQSYRDGLTPTQLVEEIQTRLAKTEGSSIWISLLSKEELASMAATLEMQEIDDLPLYGVPFAIKDNIDLLNLPTTAGCPDYSYEPDDSAFVVKRLMEAGAIPVGKTNMDQFATGLEGVCSPYGSPENAYDADYIPGGSSSGSAVAVAKGLVSFSLGTDTAGSGRVPAALNNLVSHKPTRGLLSSAGVVPACRSLDSVSILATSAEDAETVLNITALHDPEDAYSTACPYLDEIPHFPADFSFGVPRKEQLNFFSNGEAETLFSAAVEKMEALGGQKVELDFTPFLEAGALLSEGPWSAERYVAIEEVMKNRPDILHPVTREIIAGGAEPSAADYFKAEYRLKDLKRLADRAFQQVNLIITPTVGTVYTREEVAAEHLKLNSNLGYYTNFMNLLDYSATAFPAGFYEGGMPFGISAFSLAFHDKPLLELAQRFRIGEGAVVAEEPLHDDCASGIPDGWIPVVVYGAHLEGQPLNWQLTDRGAQFWKATQTAPVYELYALPPLGDTIPPRPAVLRVNGGGSAIQVELWAVPEENFGSFVAGISAPLGIGKVLLDDGAQYPGFICEPYGLEGAENISHLGDWRKFNPYPV